MKSKKKDKLSTKDLIKNYKKIIKGKQINDNGKELFDKTIKKAIPPKKPNGSK